MRRVKDGAVHVVGGGAVGLTLAVRLLSTGRAVTVFENADRGQSASAIAAGMLAPQSESLRAGPAAFALLRESRDLWLDLAAGLRLSLDRSGAVHLVERGAGVGRRSALLALGGEARSSEAPEWITAPDRWDAVWTPEDWRLDPHDALAALERTFLQAGGQWRREVWSPNLTGGAVVVVAAGWAAHVLAPEVSEVRRLSPIKGQILRFGGGPTTGPVVHLDDVYLAPAREGLVVGATMEVGVADTRIDADQGAWLSAAALRVTDAVAGFGARQQTGVRAATPDGWPMVGPTAREGVWLATGARRIGWLLAPLMAEVIVAHLEGRGPGEAGAMFDPKRFD